MKLKNISSSNGLTYIFQADFEYLINLLINGAFLATLTTEMGISDSLTGIIGAFASLGRLFQMFSVFLRHGSVKRFVLFLSIANQTLFTLLYIIPIGTSSPLKITIFVFCMFTALLIYNIAHPQKTDWFMSTVPYEKRGRFTANKEIVSLVSGILFNFAMSALIDRYKSNGDMKTAFLLCAVTIAVLSVLHTLTLIFTQDKPAFAKNDTSKPYYMILCNKRVIKIAAVAGFWYVSYYSTTSFYATYQIKELGLSLTFISAVTIVSFIARILISRFWGIYADRHSFAKVLCLCFFVAAIGHLSMTFAVAENGKLIFPFYLVCTAIAQGGIGSALLNICYDYISVNERSGALAVSEAVGGSFGFLSTFFMSILVQRIQADGNRFLGLDVFAQQVTSFIAFIIEIAAIIYVVFIILPLPKYNEVQKES